jgi:hypothetical protein
MRFTWALNSSDLWFLLEERRKFFFFFFFLILFNFFVFVFVFDYRSLTI